MLPENIMIEIVNGSLNLVDMKEVKNGVECTFEKKEENKIVQTVTILLNKGFNFSISENVEN